MTLEPWRLRFRLPAIIFAAAALAFLVAGLLTEGTRPRPLLWGLAEYGLDPVVIGIACAFIATIMGLIARRRSTAIIGGIIVGLAIITVITGVLASQFRRPRGVNEEVAVAHLRTINSAQVTYVSNNGAYGTIEDLVRSGLLDDRFQGSIDGYRFAVIVLPQGYTASAVPDALGTPPQVRRYAYFSSEDAIVRYSTDAKLAPPERAGMPADGTQP